MDRIEKEEYNSIVYSRVDNYNYKLQVVQDLDAGKRVVILSDKDDILQYYGQLLDNYGQYNLYKIEDWEDVNDEFVEEVAQRDQTRDEAIVYVGKPLSETVIEVINSLKLTSEQERILSIVKDLIKGSDSDVKQQAALNLLNERLLKERAENKQLKSELDELKTTITQTNSSTQYTRNTIHLDTFITSETQVLYIKEYHNILYFNTLIRNYQKYLETKLGLRAKIVIFDTVLFEMYETDKYKRKIASLDDYMGNRQLFLDNQTVVSNQIYPLFVNDLYKNGFDVLIFIDRILNKQSMIDGKNVHTLYTVGHKNQLEYYKEKLLKDPTIKVVVSSRLNYPEGISIETISRTFESEKDEFYWYNKLRNKGNDKRYIFEILDEIRKPNRGKK